MATKKTLNLAIPTDLLEQFNEVCKHYGHAKQKGMVLSAAILMFLRANPETQGQHLQEIATAQIDIGVKKMIEQTKTGQGLRIAPSPPANNNVTTPGEATPDPHTAPKPQRPSKAAKRARKAKRGISKLPKLDDFR